MVFVCLVNACDRDLVYLYLYMLIMGRAPPVANKSLFFCNCSNDAEILSFLYKFISEFSQAEGINLCTSMLHDTSDSLGAS